MASEHDLLPRLDAANAVSDALPARRLSDGPVTSKTAADLEQVFDVPVTVSAVLGNATLPVGEVMRLAPGAVIALDRRIGEAIDVYVNDRLVARGEVVLVEDKLGVTMTEIIKADR